jgi:cell division protease FtsH
MQPALRVRVPYSPFFLQQVNAGHVKEITSKGMVVQGTFTVNESYGGSKPTARFQTEIPAFADNDALSSLLQRKAVVVNAQPLDTGAPWWQNPLLGFSPTILFLALLFWLVRRRNVQNVLGSFGRSRARRYQPSGDRVTFADVAGIDEAQAEVSDAASLARFRGTQHHDGAQRQVERVLSDGIRIDDRAMDEPSARRRRHTGVCQCPTDHAVHDGPAGFIAQAGGWT